jgi:methionyl-tRNA synthetase
MFNLAETLRVVSIMIGPFMPSTAKKMQAQINIPDESLTWSSMSEYGSYGFENKMSKGDNLFPRVEIAEEKQKEIIAQNKKSDKKNEKKADDIISIDDFAKVKLKVAEVIECEKHPDADRLLVLQVRIGKEKRQIVSGIAQYYSAEDMVGKKVVVITNLKKTKIRGIESQGMILAAADKKDLNLVTVDKDISDGTEVR